jgi:hypothetical protein
MEVNEDASGPAEEPKQNEDELMLLEALLDARERFFEDLVAWGENYNMGRGTMLSSKDAATLRGGYVYQVAEFYYLLRVYKRNSRDSFRDYLNVHNQRMRVIKHDVTLLTRMGFEEGDDRIGKAIFPSSQMDFAVQSVVAGRVQLQRRSLGRLLAVVMSPQTCRNVVAVLLRAGLLEERTVKRVDLVAPTENGDLERLYGEHLSRIVTLLRRRDG